MTQSAAGLGLATVHGEQTLDVWYPHPTLGSTALDVIGLEQAVHTDDVRGVNMRTVLTVINDLAEPPADTADAYLRLHLLSHRLVQPRSERNGGTRRASQGKAHVCGCGCIFKPSHLARCSFP